MKRYLATIAAALAVLSLLTSTVPASAATAPAPSNTTGSSGLSITPRKDIHLSPGQTVTDKLSISNLNGGIPLNLSLKAIDFTFTNDTGTPKLFLDDNAPQTAWSIKPFLKLPESISIPAGQTKVVDYTLTIPKGQGAGSYYSAIEYVANGANGGNVALNASGVTLVFVSVPGTVNEKLTLKKFGAFQPNSDGQTGKFIGIALNGVPTKAAFSLQNTGNVVEAPAGSITITSMFGKQAAFIKEANPVSSLALIGQTRRFDACIVPTSSTVQFQGSPTRTTVCAKPKFLPGRYTLSMDVLYGQNGNKSQEIIATAHFWYLPWWFLIAVLVILLIIAGGIWWVYRKIANRGRSKASGRRFRR